MFGMIKRGWQPSSESVPPSESLPVRLRAARDLESNLRLTRRSEKGATLYFVSREFQGPESSDLGLFGSANLV